MASEPLQRRQGVLGRGRDGDLTASARLRSRSARVPTQQAIATASSSPSEQACAQRRSRPGPRRPATTPDGTAQQAACSTVRVSTSTNGDAGNGAAGQRGVLGVLGAGIIGRTLPMPRCPVARSASRRRSPAAPRRRRRRGAAQRRASRPRPTARPRRRPPGRRRPARIRRVRRARPIRRRGQHVQPSGRPGRFRGDRRRRCWGKSPDLILTATVADPAGVLARPLYAHFLDHEVATTNEMESPALDHGPGTVDAGRPGPVHPVPAAGGARPPQ